MAYGYNPVDEEEQEQKQGPTGAPAAGPAAPAPAAPAAPVATKAPAQAPQNGTGHVNLSRMLGLHQNFTNRQQSAWNHTQQRLNNEANSAAFGAGRAWGAGGKNNPNATTGDYLQDAAYGRANDAAMKADAFSTNKASGLSGFDRSMMGAGGFNTGARNLQSMMLGQQMTKADATRVENVGAARQWQQAEIDAEKKASAARTQQAADAEKKKKYDAYIEGLRQKAQADREAYKKMKTKHPFVLSDSENDAALRDYYSERERLENAANHAENEADAKALRSQLFLLDMKYSAPDSWAMSQGYANYMDYLHKTNPYEAWAPAQ